MQFDKGRSKPIAWNTEIPDDSIEAKLAKLSEIQEELHRLNMEHKEKTKHLRETSKSLKNIITAEVLAIGKTVTAGNMRAEFVPTVVIKRKKEENDGE